MPIDRWMDKKMWPIYTIKYYLAIKKNEIMPFAATWMNLEILILSKVSQTKKNTIWYNIICDLYVGSKIWYKSTYLWNKNRLTDIENRLVVEFGINRGKLLYIEWINNKVLLYSTGNYIQYPVTNHNEKEYIYIFFTSLYRRNEHNIVNQLYFNKILKKKKKKREVGWLQTVSMHFCPSMFNNIKSGEDSSLFTSGGALGSEIQFSTCPWAFHHMIQPQVQLTLVISPQCKLTPSRTNPLKTGVSLSFCQTTPINGHLQLLIPSKCSAWRRGRWRLGASFPTISSSGISHNEATSGTARF